MVSAIGSRVNLGDHSFALSNAHLGGETNVSVTRTDNFGRGDRKNREMPSTRRHRDSACFHNIEKADNHQAGKTWSACAYCAGTMKTRTAERWWRVKANWSQCAWIGKLPEWRVKESVRLAAQRGQHIAELDRDDRRDATPWSFGRKRNCGICYLCLHRGDGCFENFESDWEIRDGRGHSQKVQVVSYDATTGTHSAYVTELWCSMVEKAPPGSARTRRVKHEPPFTAYADIDMKSLSYTPWDECDAPAQWRPRPLEFEKVSKPPFLQDIK